MSRNFQLITSSTQSTAVHCRHNISTTLATTPLTNRHWFVPRFQVNNLNRTTHGSQNTVRSGTRRLDRAKIATLRPSNMSAAKITISRLSSTMITISMTKTRVSMLIKQQLIIALAITILIITEATTKIGGCRRTNHCQILNL